jgi:SAM-dependent methyltransferase
VTSAVKQQVKALIGPRWTTRLRCLGRGLGLPRWGNLRRVEPFSSYFGFDRGTPVDRYYLEQFLDAHRASITGDVLEIQMVAYVRRYGHDVRRADSVDIDPRLGATFVCDLARSDGVLPGEAYDCFLMPSTLQHLRDPEASLRHALRVLRPGGVLLATAVGFVPLIPDGPDYWRHSAQGWTELLDRVWPGGEVEVRSHGNCLAAVACMLGLAVEELTPAELDVTDARYPVVISVVCRKPRPAAVP